MASTGFKEKWFCNNDTTLLTKTRLKLKQDLYNGLMLNV